MMIEAGFKDQAIIGCKAMLIKLKGTPEAKTLQAMINILSPPPPPPAKPNKEIPTKK